MKDYLQVLQENLRPSAEDWILGAVGCSNRTMILNMSEVVNKWINQARIEVWNDLLKVMLTVQKKHITNSFKNSGKNLPRG